MPSKFQEPSRTLPVEDSLVAKKLCVKFIFAKEPNTMIFASLQSPDEMVTETVKVQFQCSLLTLHEIKKTLTYHNIGIALSPKDREELFKDISRRVCSMPEGSDHIYVCVMLLETIESDNKSCVLPFKYNVMTGIHVDEDKAISWDVVEPFNDVLQVCKPPIPCLKKFEIEQVLDLEEELCCAICLQVLVVGSEAAQTICSHVYHCYCIVKWLKGKNICPLCRFRLPIS